MSGAALHPDQTYARALCMALWTSHWISAKSRAGIGLAESA